MADVSVKVTINVDGGNAKSVFTGVPAFNGGSASTANTAYIGVAIDGGTSSG